MIPIQAKINILIEANVIIFILGNRKEFRLGEKIGIIIFKLLNPLFVGPLKKMRSIHSETIAKAILPFLAVEAIVIFLITYFPAISMTVPLLTGFAK